MSTREYFVLTDMYSTFAVNIVELANPTQTVGEGLFCVTDLTLENEDTYNLTFILADSDVTAEAENLFDAMCSIRRQLEIRGLLLVCYGASRNVYPSPLLLSMGDGDKAYKLRLGQTAKISDLVSIFEAGLDVFPVTVEEQKQFYQNWLMSL